MAEGGSMADVVPGRKRPAHIPIDSPLRFRRKTYIYGVPPSNEAAPHHLPTSVDAVVAKAIAEGRLTGWDDKSKPGLTEIKGMGMASMDNANIGPHLVDSATGVLHPLPSKGTVTLGCNSTCDVVVVGERYVSKRHCILHCTAVGIGVEDVSSNSTYINGTPAPKGRTAPLLHDDKLTLTRCGSGWFFRTHGRGALTA